MDLNVGMLDRDRRASRVTAAVLASLDPLGKGGERSLATAVPTR